MKRSLILGTAMGVAVLLVLRAGTAVPVFTAETAEGAEMNGVARDGPQAPRQ